MEDIVELRCCVCVLVYTDKAPPRNLSCGHSVCSSCLAQIFNEGKQCPECRKSFNAKKVEDLQINYPMLRLARMYAFATIKEEELPPAQLELKWPEGEPAESKGVCPKHGHQMFFSCQSCDEYVCRDCVVSDHPDQPYGRCLIVSLKQKAAIMKEGHLSALKICLEKSDKAFNNVKKSHKFAEIAVRYWEKRPEDVRPEDYDRNLEESRALELIFRADLDKIRQLRADIKDATTKLDETQKVNVVVSVVEDSTKCVKSFENFVAQDKQAELDAILSKFWNGKK